jgi:hypothetical protein
MQAIAERHARPNAKGFDRPYRDGPVVLHHFPVRSAGLVLLKSYPSRKGRSSDAAIAERHARPNAKRFDRPYLQATADQPGQVLSIQS